MLLTGACVLTRLVMTTEDLYNNKVSCALHIVNIHTMGKVFSALIVHIHILASLYRAAFSVLKFILRYT